MRLSEHQRQERRPGPVEAGGSPEADPAGGAALLDPEAIERLRQLDPGGQQGVLVRILRAYETSLARHLDEVMSAAVAGDAERLRRSAHTLKSSSSAVGALVFAQQCADLERMAEKAACQPGPGAVEAMVHEGRRVLVAVRTMLAR